MEIIRDHKENSDHLVVAIGNFDGIHLGHQKLISETLRIAKENQYIPGLITFYPHPRDHFNKFTERFNILSFKSKMKILSELGIEKAIILRFNDKIANLSPVDFFYCILENLNIKHIVVGFNFKFGKTRSGDIKLLSTLVKESNISLSVIEQFKVKNIVCSSSEFRKYLTQAKFNYIKLISGREYFLEGKIVKGNKLASKIGYPTANIELRNLLTPKSGVYKSIVDIDGVEYKSISNIGFRPTIGGDKKLLETYLFEFNKNIYGKKIKVKLLNFIREERKFDNLESLKIQIDEDIIQAQ